MSNIVAKGLERDPAVTVLSVMASKLEELERQGVLSSQQLAHIADETVAALPFDRRYDPVEAFLADISKRARIRSQRPGRATGAPASAGLGNTRQALAARP